jgi:hypothetical protein
LINEETRINDPVDISYVYNGYSPLSVKFVENIIMSHGLKNMEERKCLEYQKTKFVNRR